LFRVPLPPQDSPEDHEANLFTGSSERAKELYAQTKRVRRLAARREWWNQNKPQPKATDETRGGDIET
jgi:hypothetical protein